MNPERLLAKMDMEFGITVSYFLWSLALGGCLAFAYDLLRVTRRIVTTSVFGVNLEDICFFLFAGLVLFWTAYDKNGGQLRFQGFLGAIFGFTLYRRILKDRLVNFLVLCYDAFLKILFWVLKFLLFPIQIVYKVLSKPFLVIAWYSREKARQMNGKLRARQEQKKIRKKCKKTELKKRRNNRKNRSIKRKIAVDKG